MAKINISFNGTTFSINEQAYISTVAELQQHFLSTMNGAGAAINFGGIAYSVDSTKLSNATSDFINHLGTIAGSGATITINGREFPVDSSKLGSTISKLHTRLDDLSNFPDSIEDLENEYEFIYFSTLEKAVSAINAGALDSYDATKETAGASVYEDKTGKLYALLLKDEKTVSRLQPSVDMTINLGGHKLSSADILCINVKGGTFVLDGRLPGSGIAHTGTSSTIGCIQVPATSTSQSVTILGGTYTVTNTNGGNAVGLNLKSLNCVTTVKDCAITAVTTNNKANGCVNDGITVFTKCDMRAYCNYNLSDAGTYTALSYGVYNTGSLTMKDCYVYGTHSGIGSTNSVDIDGGTYEGFGHGGLYASGAAKTYRIYNATLKDSPVMPTGYTNTAPNNGSGIYIGGSGAANTTMYVDNCAIYGPASQLVIRGSSGEQNNTVYISNSKLYDTDGTTISVRIDNDTHKLYSGIGNNFTADNTTLPEAVVVTEDAYGKK